MTINTDPKNNLRMRIGKAIANEVSAESALDLPTLTAVAANACVMATGTYVGILARLTGGSHEDILRALFDPLLKTIELMDSALPKTIGSMDSA